MVSGRAKQAGPRGGARFRRTSLTRLRFMQRRRRPTFLLSAPSTRRSTDAKRHDNASSLRIHAAYVASGHRKMSDPHFVFVMRRSGAERGVSPLPEVNDVRPKERTLRGLHCGEEPLPPGRLLPRTSRRSRRHLRRETLDRAPKRWRSGRLRGSGCGCQDQIVLFKVRPRWLIRPRKSVIYAAVCEIVK